MDNNKVVWSEGMFLSPQHFQQQERYVEHFTREFAGQISPNAYGLTSLELDRSMLNIGKVSVRRAKGIFPDGTPFEIEQALVLDVPKNTSHKKVYLALPVSRPGTIDVGEDARLRHSSQEHPVYDTSREHSDPVQLELATLNIQLRLEGDELKDFVLISVAEISEHKSEGVVVLNQAFVPQCLQFAVSSYLTDNVADLFAQVQYRSRAIHTRLQAESSSKSYQSLMRDYLWLQVLGAWMPKLEQWNLDGSLLTRHLYLECVSMAGQMQGLEGKMPKSFPAWNQDALYSIFSTVFSELLVLLREVQIDNVSTLNWDKQLFVSRRLLRTLVDDRSLYNQGRFVLAVSSSIGATRLSEEFPRAAKLAGNSDIAGLVRNALSGVPLRHLPYAPSELKSLNDAAYFEIDTKSELWQALIKRDEAIALHIDERIDDIHVDFHVIR
ncbi:type VI secretion system baseplate subunit TssK [Vibrio parahaemolyticus]|uniref:type VI secretion system baseplate subunit TssK n=1 Tax=Vibrio TaxID=662 RepID=UPI0003A416F5|nr:MULTISPECIES: type VI secretion system baseplate subunit TssK [Vibrio]ASI96964.1 type VI secretion system-associated protein [Vibrio rotiferianus]EHW0692192.1 type VI secretion system baseplate subunit TssK [Vibrio parahaemolyticus]EIU6800765.1 type VI secretion system baseplate subunit TssK [Vibrio parahaemolyticus]EJC6765589.1 type VI secretion system baseplate subunit TssK [Vibrio parahaemolyticus]EJC6784233.1 type VI secretion system baseplate subunit TssK [Vibrio parahaemolyticus]